MAFKFQHRKLEQRKLPVGRELFLEIGAGKWGYKLTSINDHGKVISFDLNHVDKRDPRVLEYKRMVNLYIRNLHLEDSLPLFKI